MSVSITSEEYREDNITVTRNGRCIENDNCNASNPSGQFVNQPRKQEGHDVSQRTCDNRYHKGVLDCLEEDIILQDQANIVLYSQESGGF